MARIKTLRTRWILWDKVDPTFICHNVRFMKALAKAKNVTLLTTLESYHAILVVGNHRMPLPSLGKLLGFISFEGPLGDITDIETTERFLRKYWTVHEKPRREVVPGRYRHGIDNLRAWGQTAGLFWHVYGTGDRPMESGSVTIWAGDSQTSVSVLWGEQLVQGNLPKALIEEVSVGSPHDPDSFFDFLVTLGLPIDDLNDIWPAGPTGVGGSRRIRQSSFKQHGNHPRRR